MDAITCIFRFDRFSANYKLVILDILIAKELLDDSKLYGTVDVLNATLPAC